MPFSLDNLMMLRALSPNAIPLPSLPSIQEEHGIEMNRINNEAAQRALANARLNSSGTYNGQ